MAKLPKFEDWKAPWEEEGAKAFDAEEAKKFVYNVKLEREREEDAHAATKTKLSETENEKAALAVKVTALEADTSLDDIKKENAELKAAAEKATQNARQVMLDAVKNEFGLTDKQVKKLDGDDLEALRLDAKETFGEPKQTEVVVDGEKETDKEGAPKTQPTRRLINGASGPDQHEKGPSRDEVLASIPD